MSLDALPLPAALMGRLANGSESDRGAKVHLVPAGTIDYDKPAALCGSQPGRTSGGWKVYHAGAKPPTCPRCLSKFAATLTLRSPI